MKLTYLGTAAAEGFPAVFCNCKFCQEARKSGDKRNIRTRSQALINDDLLIDFPADTYMHFLNNNIEGDKIKYLFITHSHQDHLYTEDFNMRFGCYAHDMRAEKIKIFCSDGAYNTITNNVKKEACIDVTLIKPFEKIRVDDYEVIPLPARHFNGDNAVFYIIKGDKTVLYAHDTGYFFDEVWDYLKNSDIRFDMISLDCTNVEIPISDNSSHMGFDNISRAVKRLEEYGCIDNNTVKYVNHFSHNGNPDHTHLEELADKIGFKVSFDGLKIEI